MNQKNSLTIVGLGPGDASLLTVEARAALTTASEVWLRTARHPTVAGLPSGPRYESFDSVYDAEDSFEAVYEQIVGRVLALSAGPEGAMYAIPGHPLFGEATARELIRRASGLGVAVRVIGGLSFLDAVAPLLALDPLEDGLLLLDALSLGAPRRMLAPQRPTLIAQVYDRRAASQAKLALLDAYPPDHPVRIVSAAGTPSARVVETTLAQLDHDASAFDHLATLYLPSLTPTADVRTFEGLRAIVAQLRAPDGGCPWDLEQTHETLKRHLLEEAYEALDALDQGDPARIAEELGDLMMQVLLHAQVAEDDAEFVIEDVIASIGTKLVRRHPHVFGDLEVSNAQEVLRNWDALKREERGEAPLLDAVPIAMPALAQAQSVQSRAAKAGVGGADAPPAARIAALIEEASQASFGEVLFGIVALAREQGIDAEEALRMMVLRFREDVAQEEQRRAT